VRTHASVIHANARIAWFVMAITSKKARRLRDALRRLIVAHGALEEARRPCGAPISLPNAYALLELLHSDELMTVSMLAEKLSIDRTNVSRLCGRMAEAGELTRQSHPDDARAQALCLTARGEKLARSVDESSARHFARLARILGGSTVRIIESLETLEGAMAQSKDEE
jgi:DNA-binding MarR family transcriptional regulator